LTIANKIRDNYRGASYDKPLKILELHTPDELSVFAQKPFKSRLYKSRRRVVERAYTKQNEI